MLMYTAYTEIEIITIDKYALQMFYSYYFSGGSVSNSQITGKSKTQAQNFFLQGRLYICKINGVYLYSIDYLLQTLYSYLFVMNLKQSPYKLVTLHLMFTQYYCNFVFHLE